MRREAPRLDVGDEAEMQVTGSMREGWCGVFRDGIELSDACVDGRYRRDGAQRAKGSVDDILTGGGCSGWLCTRQSPTGVGPGVIFAKIFMNILGSD